MCPSILSSLPSFLSSHRNPENKSYHQSYIDIVKLNGAEILEILVKGRISAKTHTGHNRKRHSKKMDLSMDGSYCLNQLCVLSHPVVTSSL